MLSEFTVDAQAPCIQGHFPGEPVVPGAWLLGQIEQQLRLVRPQAQLQRFNKVKFLAPLRPGEPATLQLDDSAWPRVKVRIRGPQGEVLQASALMV